MKFEKLPESKDRIAEVFDKAFDEEAARISSDLEKKETISEKAHAETSIEKVPISAAEVAVTVKKTKRVRKPAAPKEPAIKIETPIGASGRKVSEDVIKENREYLEKEQAKKFQKEEIERINKENEGISPEEIEAMRRGIDSEEPEAKKSTEAAKEKTEEKTEEKSEKVNSDDIWEEKMSAGGRPYSKQDWAEVVEDRGGSKAPTEKEPKRPYPNEEWDEIVKTRQEQEDAKREKGPKEPEVIEPGKEKTPEQVLEKPDLAACREKFARADIETAKSRKELKKYNDGKDFLDSIKAGDLALLARPLETLTAEEKKEYGEAAKRRDIFKERVQIRVGVSPLDAERLYGDIAKYTEALAGYKEGLKFTRADKYEQAVEDIERLGLPKQIAEERMKKRMEDIVKETVVDEANHLYDEKMRVNFEKKGGATLADKAWRLAGRGVERYRKMDWKKKAALSVALGLGGVGAGMIGGVAGAALASGLLVGKWTQRAFGGAATGVALEAGMHRAQERQGERKTLEKFKGLTNILDQDNKNFDDRLFELDSKKRGEKYRRYILAGVAGGIIGFGVLGKAIHNIGETGFGRSIKEIWSSWFSHGPTPGSQDLVQGSKLDFAVSHKPGSDFIASHGLESVAPYEIPTGGPQIAESGDSVWKIINRQLSDKFKERFTNLDPARKTYLTDWYKDQVVAHPEKYGLANANFIEAGKSYDFLPGGGAHFDNALDHAMGQTQEALNSISAHDHILDQFAHAHPNVMLTEEKVDEILFGHSGGSVHGSAAESLGSVIQPESSDALVQGENLDVSAGPGGELPLNEEIKIFAHDTAGLNDVEYSAIRNLKVDKLLAQIPSKGVAWENWRLNGPSAFDLPHEGSYDNAEFSHHVKLAEFVRSFNPGAGMKQATVEQFLRLTKI